MTSHLDASPYALPAPWTQEPDYAEFTLNGFTFGQLQSLTLQLQETTP